MNLKIRWDQGFIDAPFFYIIVRDHCIYTYGTYDRFVAPTYFIIQIYLNKFLN